MKNPFRKSPIQNYEATLVALTKRGEQLAVKRALAQTALDAAIKARQHALLSVDLDNQPALDKALTAITTATSELAGIDGALAVLAQEKSEAERQLSAERERIKRAAAADKLAKQVAAIEAALPGYLDHSRVLAAALSEVGHWHFESGQMANFVQNAMGQIEVAANFTLTDLKAMPDAIRQGRQAIPGEPAPMPVVVTEPAPATQTIFMMRSAKYRDHDGRERFAGQWEDATMPVETAQRALSEGIAVPLTDDRRAQLRGARGGDFNPKAPDVVDLDAVEGDISPALREANFTVLDRSADARSILIEVPRL